MFFICHALAAATCTSPLFSPLPVRQPCDELIDRPRLVSHRRIRTARAIRMLALSALPAPLIILKAKRTGGIPAPTPRTHRRNPIVLTPAMLTLAADRHTSTLPKPPAPHQHPLAQQATARPISAPQPKGAPHTSADQTPFAAQPRAPTASPLSKSVRRPASNTHAQCVQSPWALLPPYFSIFVSRDTVTFPLSVCLHSPASPASRSPSSNRRLAPTAAATPLLVAARARRSLRSCSSGAAPHASACSRPAPRPCAIKPIHCA